MVRAVHRRQIAIMLITVHTNHHLPFLLKIMPVLRREMDVFSVTGIMLILAFFFACTYR